MKTKTNYNKKKKNITETIFLSAVSVLLHVLKNLVKKKKQKKLKTKK